MPITVRCGVLDETSDTVPMEGAPLFWPVLKSVENSIPAIHFLPETVCVFASKQAVKVVRKSDLKFEKFLTFAAVGASTAALLEKWRKVYGEFEPIFFDQNREGLKAVLETLTSRNAKNIVLFCAGDGVSQSIAQEFCERVHITIVPCYQTVPSLINCPISKVHIENAELVTFSCFSGKVLSTCYHALLKMFDAKNHVELPASVVFSFGNSYKTAVDEAHRLGLPESRLIRSDL